MGSLFETCCLGSHAPAGGAAAVHAFSLQHPASGTAGEAAAATWRQRPLAARYVAGLRHACEQLQRRLLLDPPAELQEGVGASLEDGSAALVVYLACPLEQPADQVAALLEAAACLAPCTLLGADAGGVAAGLCLDSPGGVQQPQPQQLEPCAPQQPDRPAGATPAADNSRAPGGSPPPDEQDEEEGEVKGQPGSAGAGGQQAAGQQAAEQQRYHGAASVLHEQQQGDFRRLPVLQLQRPEGSSPSNIVLQVRCWLRLLVSCMFGSRQPVSLCLNATLTVWSLSPCLLQLLTPQALADLTGTAARCTAFAVYSKAQRQVQPDGSLEQMSLEPGEALPASLPFCSQPLVALASAAAAVRSAQDVQQPAASQQQQSSSEAGPQQRTLHCCYAPPLAGSSLLPLAFTDSCGELVHAELLNSAACGLGLGAVGSRSSGGAAAAGSNAGSDVDSGIPASVVCRAVLQRCIELLASLRAVSGMADALQDLAISAVGMQPSEQEAWRQLLQHDARHDVLQQMGLPQDSCLSVVELQALPPARCVFGQDSAAGRLARSVRVQHCLVGLPHTPPATHWHAVHIRDPLGRRSFPACRFAGPDPPSGCLLLLEQQERSHLPQQQACIAWLPPASGSSSLLPQEHHTVRQLEVALVAHSQGPSQGLPYSGAEPLRSVAHDLHGLAWLHAAFQGACLRTLAGGGQPAPADAHLPLHAALATQLHSLLGHACAVSAGRT